MEQKAPYSSVSQPYSSPIYHSITRGLIDATKIFASRNAQPVVNSQIRDIILKHHVEDLFSACLIHRHFDLAPNERNVESDGKAVAATDLENLYPSSWMFSDGDLYPYEFKRAKTSCPPKDFVKEYGQTLKKAGLDDLIGFQVYENGVIGFETTDIQNRVSTTVDKPEKDVTTDHLKGWAPASWAFFRPEGKTAVA